MRLKRKFLEKIMKSRRKRTGTYRFCRPRSGGVGASFGELYD